MHDERFWDAAGLEPGSAAGAARYAALASLAPGARRYAAHWASFEPDYPPPDGDCPAGTVEWARGEPAAGAVRAASAVAAAPSPRPRRRHCYAEAAINQTAAYLALDAAHGIQSVATLWRAPERARDARCAGAARGGAGAPRAPDFGGCAPTLAAMPDFADFVAFLGDRFRGKGGGGRFSAFEVWAAAASASSFDLTPTVAGPGTSPTVQAAVIQRYAALVRATADALTSVGAPPALVLAAVDATWATPPRGDRGGRPHIGSGVLVDGLWAELGVGVDWSVGVAPYGAAGARGWPASCHVSDLPSLAASQRARAAALGVSDPARAPQAVLAATEFGWPAAGARAPAAAASVCAAHAAALATPGLAFAAHVEFQGGEPGDPAGLVPAEAGPGLDAAAAAASPTLAALRSTSPDTWGRGGGHYCCLVHALGCGGGEVAA